MDKDRWGTRFIIFVELGIAGCVYNIEYVAEINDFIQYFPKLCSREHECSPRWLHFKGRAFKGKNILCLKILSEVLGYRSYSQ